MSTETKALTPEEFTKLSEKLGAIVDNDEARAKMLDELKIGWEKVTGDIDVLSAKMSREIATVKRGLARSYGESGASDWLQEMSKFIRGVAQHKWTGKVDSDLTIAGGIKVEDLLQTTKATVDYVTSYGASPYAGYLLPEILRPGIVDLKQMHGNLYPLFTKFNAPPGVNVYVPAIAQNALADWREGVQLTAMDEAGVTTGTIAGTSVPTTFTRDTINTKLLGTWVEIANELLVNPSINFSAVLTANMIRGMIRTLEFSVIQCDADETTPALRGPSNGILLGGTGETTIGSGSLTNVISFLKECSGVNEYMNDETAHMLLLTPRDKWSLIASSVESTNMPGMLSWANAETGAPGRFMGYRWTSHPGLVASSTYYIALGDPSSILLAESPAYTIDINPLAGTQFIANASMLRIFNHYDWSLGQATEWHYAVVTA